MIKEVKASILQRLKTYPSDVTDRDTIKSLAEAYGILVQAQIYETQLTNGELSKSSDTEAT